MNFKKFISGVSAFAIAASAFAAMAVTANAETREVAKAVYGTPTSNITSVGDGTYTVSNTNLGAIIADFSALEGIDEATSVTVQFDTKLPTVSSGGKSYIAPVMFGVGDKAVRGINGNGSTKTNYVKDGLVAYFGSENGTTYYVNGTGTNYVQSVRDTDVRATITLDRTTGEYTGKLQTSSASVPFSGTTDVDNLTVLEVTTRGLSGYTFTFKNIKVTYTVPDAPVEPVVSSNVVAAQAFTTPDYDENMVVGVISLNVSEAAIDLADATYQGQTGTVTGDTSFIGEALINVVINGATSVDALEDVVFN